MRIVTRSSSACAALMFVASLVACADHAAPTELRAAPGLASFAAMQTKGEGVLVGFNPGVFLDCIGEMASIQSAIPYRFHLVVTPSGNIHYSDPYIPNGGATGTIVGLTTGRVWTLERAVSPEVINSNGAGQSAFFTTNNWYVSETGPTLNFHNTFRFRQNASGEIVVESLEARCIAH